MNDRERERERERERCYLWDSKAQAGQAGITYARNTIPEDIFDHLLKPGLGLPVMLAKE